jgi:putative glutamine amidotransferase
MSALVRVGLTIGRYHDSATPYRQALEAAGLEVVVLPSTEVDGGHREAARHRLSDLDGVVLAGGGDIDPALLGDAPHPTVYGVDRNRDEWERAVFDEAWSRAMPVFAICRGMQVMNWALGGTLHPDVDACCPPMGAAKSHRQTDLGFPRSARTHEVALVPSRLRDILGADRIAVNSIHHQAVARVAGGLVVTALADDGVVEGFESASRDFALGVQFHPEELWRDEEAFARLFAAFGQAAERYRRRATVSRAG